MEFDHLIDRNKITVRGQDEMEEKEAGRQQSVSTLGAEEKMRRKAESFLRCIRVQKILTQLYGP